MPSAASQQSPNSFFPRPQFRQDANPAGHIEAKPGHSRPAHACSQETGGGGFLFDVPV